MNFLYQIAYSMPEILLSFSIFVFALISKFFDIKSSRKIVAKIAMILMTIAFLIAFVYHSSNLSLQVNLFDYNSYSYHVKTFLLACSGVCLIFFSRKNFYKNTTKTLYIIFFSIVLSLMISISSNNLLSLYIGLEMYAISICFLIMSENNDNNRSLEIATKYIILSAIMSGIFLFGVSLFYSDLGHVSFINIEKTKIGIPCTLGILFIMSYLLFKLNLVPFHTWSIVVYEKSSNLVVLLLDSLFKLVLCTIFVHICSILHTYGIFFFKEFLLFVAMASILIGGVVPFKQKNIKRFIAYVSIGHTGFAFIILSLFKNMNDLKIVIMYAFSYFLASICFFSGFIGIQKYKKVNTIEDLDGVISQFPVFGYTMFLGLSAMVGVPPFLNFLTKIKTFEVIVSFENYAIIIITVIFTILTIGYTTKVIRHMFIKSEDIVIDNTSSFLKKFCCVSVVFFLLLGSIMFKYIDEYIDKTINAEYNNKMVLRRMVDLDLIKKDLENMFLKRKTIFD